MNRPRTMPLLPLASTLALSLSLSLTLGVASAPVTAGTEPAAGLRIRDVCVVTMQTPEVACGRTVVIDAGRVVDIHATGDGREAPGERVIEGRGRYLMPGLADMHTHLGLVLPQDGDPTMADMESDLQLYLPNGVTAIRNMRATPGLLELRRRLQAGELLGPRLIASGPSLNTSLPESFGPNVRNREEAVAAVRRQHNAGYDLIKVHQVLAQEAYNAVLDTAAELALPVAGHAQSDKPALQSARLSSLEHAEEVAELLGDEGDFSTAPQVLETLRRGGVYVTPTLAVFDMIHRYLTDPGLAALYARPDTRYASAYWRHAMQAERNFFRGAFGADYENLAGVLAEDSRRLQRITQQLQEAGVPLLLGTDAVGLLPPGFSVHSELAMLVRSGLSPYEALRTATVNPALWAGLEGEAGVVAVGARADLVLLERNPLKDIHNSRSIEAVVREGRWLDRTALDAMLEARRDGGARDASADGVQAPGYAP